MQRPKALDLFAGAGGASMGLHMAGFEVWGVDIRPQPRYPFPDRFIQGDALTVPLDGYDFIWASPPCQAFSIASHLRGCQDQHPVLIGEMRERLAAAAVPYAIENVTAAPLHHPIVLCGSMFGLRVFRHRGFETSWWLLQPGHVSHPANATVTRVGYGRRTDRPPLPYERQRIDGYITVAGHLFRLHEGRAAMGIDWMTRAELSQAVPPSYAHWIGEQALRVLGREAVT